MRCGIQSSRSCGHTLGHVVVWFRMILLMDSIRQLGLQGTEIIAICTLYSSCGCLGSQCVAWSR